MNILLLTSEFLPAQGGIGTYARELASAATGLGAHVTLVAPDYGIDRTQHDRALPFRVRRFSGGLHSMRDLPAKVRLTRRLVTDVRYDVVHAADWPFFIPAALSRGLTRAQLMMTVHGTEINEMQTRAKRLAIRAAGVFGPRTEVVANSAFTRDLFLKHFPLPDDRVRVTSLGVSNFWLGAHAPRLAVRQRLDIAGDAIVMVTVARLTRRKGQLLTLKALAAVPQHIRKRIVWLVIGPDGEPDYVTELKSTAATTGCNVRFPGALPDDIIRDIYGAADFFCLTGLHEQSGRVEGFGLAYLEAAACGLPSVATAVGGVPDAVITGTTGVLVDPLADSVAAAIAVMSEEVEKRLWLGKGASAHARAMSWERCAAATYGISSGFDAPMRPARSRSTMP